MNKIFSRLLTFLGLFVFAGAALADSSNTLGNQIGDPAVTNHTDMSISYLSQVFGTVGSTLHGTTGQMLGQLFDKFNIGMVVVTVGFLIYTTVTTAVNMALNMEGSLKKAALVGLKIALGVGMILPNPTTGYSVFQDVVMKVVVEGVALADMTWRYGLTYLVNGGALWQPPSVTTSNSINFQTLNSAVSSQASNIKNNVMTQPYNVSILDVPKQIFNDEVCMVESSNIYHQKNPNATNYEYQVNFPGQVNNQGGISTSSNFTFPGYPTDTPGTPGAALGQSCGSINPATVYGASVDQVHLQYAIQAIGQMVNDLMPAAQKMVCANGGNLPECTGSQTSAVGDNIQSFFGAIVDYLNAVTPIANFTENQALSAQLGFVNQAETEGWMSAGRYEWDLSQVAENAQSATDLLKYLPTVAAPLSSTLPGDPVMPLVTPAVQNYYVGTADNSGVVTLLQNNANNANAGTGDVGQTSIPFPEDLFVLPILSPLNNLIGSFGNAQGVDPLMFLHNVGVNCFAVIDTIWIYIPLILFALMLPLGICNSAYDGSHAFGQIADWIKTPLMLLAGLLLPVGAILTIYLPMYPFILFLFGIIGWLIAVMEAMVAAPIICLGLTHPEGHDFLGKGEQLLMLLLSVFIRPVLMILGMIAGMILSYVSFSILNYTYSGFMSDFFTSINTGPAGGNVGAAAFHASQNMGVGQFITADFVVLPTMLVILAILCYLINTQCYSTIYTLSDTILKWIGGPTSQSSTAQMVELIKGGAGATSKGAGDSISKISDTTGINQAGLSAAAHAVQNQNMADGKTEHGGSK